MYQITTYPQPNPTPPPSTTLFLRSLSSENLLTRLYVIFKAVHGMEYGFGAHEYPSSGVFEVEPKSCPGFVFRRSVLLGSTDMSRSDFQSFIEHLSSKYHGDTYHLIAKNCNHFTDDLCQRLTGKPIPGWVNRLARLGKDHIGLCALFIVELVLYVESAQLCCFPFSYFEISLDHLLFCL